MKNIRNHTLICLTATFLLIMFTTPQAWATTLENGIPFNTSVNSMSYGNIGIVVPDRATKMTVSITGGSGDLDLYLKYGSPLSGGTIAELDADADIRSDGPSADETISINLTSTPALRAGTWYIATLNLNASETSFTITATIDFQEPQVQETKHQLEFEMNADVNIPDTSFGCSLAVVPGTVSGNVDLYVAIVLPGGTAYLLGPAGLETDLVAYKTNIPAPSASAVILPEFPLPASLPNGTYDFLALLVKTGADLANQQNWMSNLAVRSMVFAPLSPAQKAFIDKLGYPLQFVKMFSHDGKDQRIDETWIYLKQGLMENFINGVFVHEKALDHSIVDAPEGINHPERYHMDTSLSQIKSWHGEPKNTFTDNLDIGVYTTYVYDGIIFGFLDTKLISVISGK